ncbi:SusC/RagA family TonB-linked outer membrane protein [Compostibacter hankyongensis]|uniref:TonB-dependent receptor n=1 Tax=Compostibacter hankyongensis TaxID=1007089 RepID=A0ABP8FLS6_9BACT
MQKKSLRKPFFPPGRLLKSLLIMKLSLLLITAFCFNTYSAVVYSQERISLDLKSVKIKKALTLMEHLYSYRFIYSDNILPKNKITLTAKNETIGQVLEKTFAHTGLVYKILDNNLITITVKGPASGVIHIEGKVTDAANGKTLAGVTIRVKDGNTGTITDESGAYKLDVPDNAVLVVSFLGYVDQEIAVNGRPQLNIALESSSKTMSEVVVIGYGTRQKKDLTGAISDINAETIEKSTAMTPELAMKGQMAGVNVTSAGGDPSGRPTIRIRGVNTFNDANPLYVIDGVPVAEGGSGVTNDVRVTDVRSPINIFTLINPDDIASISVLKDASAAAVYGVRAANGVILITTKKGQEGTARLDLNASMGFQNIPQTFKLLNTPQFAALYQEAYANNPTLDAATHLPVAIGASTFGPAYDPERAEYLGNSPSYDWQKALLKKNAPVNNYSARISGGTSHTNYYVSAGYTYMSGGLKQNNQERYTVASNLTARVNKFFETGLNLRLADENTLQNTQGDLSIFKAPPWQPIYDPNGRGGFAPVVSGTFKVNPDYDPGRLVPGPDSLFDQGPTLLWGPQAVTNALGEQAFNSTTYNNQMFIGSAYAQITPLTGLKIRATVSGELYNLKRKTWTDYRGWLFSQTPGNPYQSQNGDAGGAMTLRQTRTNNLIKALNVDYSRIFGKHSIELMADASDQHYTWDVMGSSSTQVNYADPDLRYYESILPYAGGSYSRWQNYALIGYLGRLSYKYNDEYYLDATVRRDGSSRFAPGHQWGTFPSFSVAWRITREDFMKSLSWLNDLKIRGGYGVLGNEQTTSGFAYLYTASFNPHYALGSGDGDGHGNMQIASFLPTFSNENLSWEKVYTTSVGIDALLFNNTLSLTADYYHKMTKGIIQSVPLPANAGIEMPMDQNVADVLNRGFELQAGYNRNFGKLGFSVSANLTTVHNEVRSLYLHIPNRPLGLEEGYPIGYIYGYKVGGIFQNTQETDDWKARYRDAIGSNDPRPGDIYFQDLYGNPVAGQTTKNTQRDSLINDNDQTYLGSTIPGYYYGFNLGLSYSRFDLSVFFQGVGDVKKYNPYRAVGEAMSANGINQLASTLNHWTADNHSTTMPRAVFNDPNHNTRMSDRFVESAAYLRLQNVQLGYTLPSPLLQRTGFIRSIRLYLSGVNLFTLTKWSGPDPENDVVPSTRQFIAGIRASF